MDIVTDFLPVSNTSAPKLSFNELRAQMRRLNIFTARLIGDNLAEIPSATEPGIIYTVAVVGDRAICSCEDGGARCWHGKRAQELIIARAQQDTPNPPPNTPASAPKPTSDKQERYLAALSELYPEAA